MKTAPGCSAWRCQVADNRARAREIAEARCDHDNAFYFCDYCQRAAELIEAALDAAEQRGAERALERAAKVAESFYDHMEHYITVESGHAAEDIAAAIRALPPAPPA